jgi:hypothetical protein
MGFFSNFFSGKSKGEDDKPAIYGGDGLTKHTPAIINCGSMRTAQTLMDRVITSHCGGGWTREVDFTLKDPKDPRKSIKMISVCTEGGDKQSFYFDLSRPVKTAVKLQGMLDSH